MMSKLFRFGLFFLVLFSVCSVVYAATINPLTKPYADTLYCSINNCGSNGSSNSSGGGASVTNSTIFIDWSQVLGLGNESVIRTNNISWCPASGNSSQDIWNTFNSTILYDFNVSKLMSGGGDNPTNATIVIAWTQITELQNDTIIRAINTSWITANQNNLYNTSQQIWTNVLNSTILYDYNKTWITVENNPTNATINIPLSQVTDWENGSIIRVMNTSWIVRNENNPTNATITLTEAQISDLQNYLLTSSNCSNPGSCPNVLYTTNQTFYTINTGGLQNIIAQRNILDTVSLGTTNQNGRLFIIGKNGTNGVTVTQATVGEYALYAISGNGGSGLDINNIGKVGGGYYYSTGDGGSSTSTNPGAPGGSYDIYLGDGGLSASGIAGSGGNLSVIGGAGASSTNTAGSGSSIIFKPGARAVSLYSGHDGYVLLAPSIGTVGIGITEPTHKFVIGSNSSINMSEYGDMNMSGNLLVGKGAKIGGDKVNISDTGQINTSGEILTQTGLGIGIGIDNLTYKLQVQDATVRAANISNTLFVDGLNKRVGIGSSVPGTALYINGSSPTLSLVDSNDPNFKLTFQPVYSWTNLFNMQFYGGANIIKSYAFTNRTLPQEGVDSGRYILMIGDNSAYVEGIQFSVSGLGGTTAPNTSAFTIERKGVGVGTVQPAHSIQINGSSSAGINMSNTGDINMSGNLVVNGLVGVGTVNPSYLFETALVNQAVNLSSVVYVNGTAAKMGVGTSTPRSRVVVSDSSMTGGVGGSAILTIAGATNVLGYAQEIGFIGWSGSAYVPWATIGTVIENATSYNTAGIAFSTRSANTNAAPTERMRISSLGNVGIGTKIAPHMLTIGADNNTNISSNGDINTSNNLIVKGVIGINKADTLSNYSLEIDVGRVGGGSFNASRIANFSNILLVNGSGIMINGNQTETTSWIAIDPSYRNSYVSAIRTGETLYFRMGDGGWTHAFSPTGTSMNNLRLGYGGIIPLVDTVNANQSILINPTDHGNIILQPQQNYSMFADGGIGIGTYNVTHLITINSTEGGVNISGGGDINISGKLVVKGTITGTVTENNPTNATITITASQISNLRPSPWVVGAATIYNDTSGVKVGIGTSAPNGLLSVGTNNLVNITSLGDVGMAGTLNLTGTANCTFGGVCDPTSGQVRQYISTGITANSGTYYNLVSHIQQVGGMTPSTVYYAGYFSSQDRYQGTTTPHGIYINSTAYSMNPAYGLESYATGAIGNTYGGLFQATAGGGNSFGVYGKGLGGVLNYGVYGESANSSTFNYGVYSSGNLYATDYYSRALNKGISRKINVGMSTSSAVTGNCTITIENGLIVATSCTGTG
jgi:hypothetical protein